MSFVNTIDKFGDAQTFSMIVERSITEFKDDTAEIVGANAFAYCKALETVEMRNVTKIADKSSFTRCDALVSVIFPKLTELPKECFKNENGKLERADFSSLISIGETAFHSDFSLTKLILRNTETVCTLLSSDAFGDSKGSKDTPIASGTGYIYVPRALIEDYKAATNWSTYADQFRALEDYTVDGTTTGELDETKI